MRGRWLWVGAGLALVGGALLLSRDDPDLAKTEATEVSSETAGSAHRRTRAVANRRQDARHVAERVRELIEAPRGDSESTPERAALETRLAEARRGLQDRRAAVTKLIALRHDVPDGSAEYEDLVEREKMARKTLAMHERSVIRLEAKLARARAE